MTQRNAWSIMDEDEIKALGYSAAVARIEQIEARLRELAAKHRMSASEQTEYDSMGEEIPALTRHVHRLEMADEFARGAADGSLVSGSRRFSIEPGSSRGSGYDRDPVRDPASAESYRGKFSDPWDMRAVQTFGRDPREVGAELRARALSAIELMHGASDDVRQAATMIIERFDDKQGTLSRHAVATSRPEYFRAWSKMANNEAHLLMPDEIRAVEEVRAMSLTDTAGGYLVPFQLDPTVIITSAGLRNDIRQFARQVVATGDVWNGVTAGAVQFSWDAEAAEVSDDSPTLGQPSIPNHKAQGFVPISIEAIADAQNVTAEIGRLMAAGKDELEASAFITGTGSGQPKGLVTALDGTSAEVAVLSSETFAAADLYNVQGALPARHRARASWLANNLTYNKIRQFDTAGGAQLWEHIGADRPPQLLGRGAGEAEAMDGVWNVAQTADNFILVFGDFQNFVITDRLGMSVEFIPHLFGSNRRPNGQRGWWAWYRTGSDVVDPGAFKMLNLATTA